MESDEERKNRVWQTLIDMYVEQTEKARKVLKENSDIHFFPYKKGRDESTRAHLGLPNSELDAEEIMSWIYTESIADKNYTGCKNNPYIYTDDEIAKMQSNELVDKVEQWKKSIEEHMKSIKKYETLINDAEEKLKNEDN